MSRLRCHLALWLALVLLSVGRPAWAQDAVLGIVERIEQPDATGRYRTVAQADRGRLGRAGDVRVLRVGDRVSVGDVIEVETARVQLRYDTGERILLLEGTTLELSGERSLLQRVGEVYYRLRDRFTVRYGSVETVVEGTRFVVLGNGSGPSASVRVRVDEGRVSVSDGDATVPVKAGQAVRLPATGLAGAPPPVPARARLSRAEAWRAFAKNRPRVVLQVLGTGSALLPYGDGTPSLDGLAGSGGLRVGAAVGLGRMLRLSTSTALGLSGTSSDQRLRLPQEVSLGVALPGLPLAFGGGPELTYEQCTKACGGSYRALHLGGSGWVQGVVSLGPRLGLVAEARAAVGDVVRASGGFGLEVAL